MIYTEDFATEESFAAWTVIDVNNDSSTWKFDSYGEPSHVFYSYNSTNNANDWLISPAITPTETGTIAISFLSKGSSYVEKLEVFYGSTPTVEGMTNRLSEEMTLLDSETTHLYMTNATANQPIYLGFRAYSDANAWRLYIGDIKVQNASNPVDLCVTDFVSPVSGFALDQETVTVKVKNIGMVDVNTFDLVLTVDSTVIATETVNQALAIGAEMEYTFATKADLSTPRKLFTLTAATSHPDDLNPNNDASSTEVLHKAPATLPYFMGFETSEYTDGITLFNLNEDEGNWDIYSDPWWSLAHTGDVCLAYNYDKNNNGNDWAILEPIKVEEAGYYVLKFWYSGDDTHPEKLAVYYGNEGTPEAMTNKLVEYAPFARSAYEESINIFYLDSPQDLYIGFYAFSDKDENWLCVDDVTIEKVSSESVDLAITGIHNPIEYVHVGTKPTIEFDVRSYGILDAEATVVVKIDEQIVYSEATTIKAQEKKAFALSNILETLIPGTHQMAIDVTCADDNSLDNNTDTLIFNVMGEASVRWDFEDGQLPEKFVFRSEDEGTVNPSAGEEFNEAGWGIFNIQEHALYGKHVLAATSWLDGTDKADRWCVLPPFNVGKEAHLVWDVASFNPNFLETYSIMISTNGDDSWYYFTEEEYVAESSDFKTRGINLSNYAETDSVYIAFRLRSKNCEHLILDNISVYGAELSSVESVATASPSIMTRNGAIVVKGVDVTELTVHDMSGRLMASTAYNTLSTNGFTAGVYMVRVTTPTKVYTEKVVIR
ncbi:MAG: choice-of-anchor J domain-containing protein [Bacteroidales bacterium]|nr:choice-of-anchor J domain-containing protein [Bacteroidales bacterium]